VRQITRRVGPGLTAQSVSERRLRPDAWVGALLHEWPLWRVNGSDKRRRAALTV